MTDPHRDERIENVIALILRCGTLLASLAVVAGGIIYLYWHGFDVPNYHVFRGEPHEFHTLSGIVTEALHGKGAGLIELGLLLLILTPFARVAYSVCAWSVRRNYKYALLTLIVLSLLFFSMAAILFS
jgi:uncharacterized membrane protein